MTTRCNLVLTEVYFCVHQLDTEEETFSPIPHPSCSPPSPHTMQQRDYSSNEFWNNFYIDLKQNQNKDIYDWYLEYFDLKAQLLPYLTPESQVLIIGCGNSFLGEALYQDGYCNITNIDFSHTAIEIMQKRCGSTMPKMRWLCMDICNMYEINEAEFDIILDKGTCDAIMCGSQWYQLFPKLEKEMYRVLKTGGSWLMWSFANDRISLISKQQTDTEDWDWDTEQPDACQNNDTEPVPERPQRWKAEVHDAGANGHFFYVFKKVQQ